MIGDRPGTLVESHWVLNLNELCAIEDTSWIALGKFIGIRRYSHKGRNTWTEGTDLGATTENTSNAPTRLRLARGRAGTEYDAWSRGNPPAHTVTLPFSTMLAGPLDYTPGIFNIT